MPGRKLVDDDLLLEWRDDGLSYPEIIEANYRHTGIRVAKATVARAMHRLGRSRPAVRYLDTLPWKLREEHRGLHIAQMLRAQGRRARNLPMTDDTRRKLESWEQLVSDADAVVEYVPETMDGFRYRKRRPSDGDSWVRIQPAPLPSERSAAAKRIAKQRTEIQSQNLALDTVQLFSDAP